MPENHQDATQKQPAKKKKAARACIHCQKAHLTCDDSRPCQRCIKRGLASTCADGARKKAKYLQDIDDAATSPPSSQQNYPSLLSTQSHVPMESVENVFSNPMAQMHHQDTAPGNLMDNASLLGLDYGFGSSTTNLEYSILSNMLNSTSSSPPPSTTQPYHQQPYSSTTSPLQQHPQNIKTPDLASLSNMWSTASSSSPLSADPMSATNTFLESPTNTLPSAPSPTTINPQNGYIHQQQQQQQTSLPRDTSSQLPPPPPLTPSSTLTPAQRPSSTSTRIPSAQHIAPSASSVDPSMHSRPPSIASSALGSSQMSASGISTMSAYGDGAVVAKVASPVTSSTGATVKRRNQVVTPQMAYSSVNHPFSYAEGYHYLVNYVRQNMTREDLMRISRALALFRPSVLASMMNLTTDDLIFTEKCLQRTLLEYEKLITYSGTPTVVWRRTGEIALVGKEFSLLTQWSKDALMSKKTYIYELMSNSSAIDYWQNFSTHAFDNTDSAVYSSCILVSPTKRVVPCTFCFTIKRDIFDLPSVIIGNFLPILR
ncbi:hypothetical protein BCR42DRAFT_348665 [Absidia repens]|uniref:Zn(2)-C6 fungal-type domain-containing protein n=1 Tax=Absidia repens TaxID=90262 RepID=A0A1X2IPA5_9FUNG|nr:hypothetical protein BCR42DRAFT_348665 [Absidia repens]